MTDNKMLSQAEIDALLRGNFSDTDSSTDNEDVPDPVPESPSRSVDQFDALLDESERDALGEIGNISMGSASTTLSELLRQKVTITSPKVVVMTQRELFESFRVPYIVIQVEFKAGLTGYNVLVIKLRDAMIMASLMMGGDGEVVSEEISELELSAASEAMNQMIGTASTSLSTMLGRAINISPPVTTVLGQTEFTDFRLSLQDETVVVVSFDMKIGDLVDTEIMQVLSIDTAKKEAALMWGTLMESPEDGSAPPEEAAPEVEDTWLSKDLWPGEAAGRGMVEAEIPREISDIPGGPWMVPEPEAPTPRENQRRPQASDYVFSGLSQAEQRKLELLLEVPLKVSVILGRTRRPIKEVLNLTPGAIVELHSLVDDPVEVLVNGTLVAKGEVVVVNENFGVRITYIVSPEERLRQLRE